MTSAKSTELPQQAWLRRICAVPFLVPVRRRAASFLLLSMTVQYHETPLLAGAGFRPDFVTTDVHVLPWAWLCRRARAAWLGSLVGAAGVLVALMDVARALHLPLVYLLVFVLTVAILVAWSVIVLFRALVTVAELQAAGARLWDAALRETIAQQPAFAFCTSPLYEQFGQPWLAAHGIDVEAFCALGEDSRQSAAAIVAALEMLQLP